MIHGTIHHLSMEELQLLNRGPTYVIPCQMHISFNSLSLNQILTQQMAPLQQQLTKIFTKYLVDPSHQRLFQQRMEEQFIKSFSVPIPSVLEKRVLYEKQLVQSIQYQLKRDELILRRTADENNTYYLGCLQGFNLKANNDIENASYLEMIGIIDEFNSEQYYLTESIKSIDSTLKYLQQQNRISTDMFNKLQIGKRMNMKLPSLYFLPETHHEGHMEVQPRLTSWKTSPIYTLATYLDQFLRPLFNKFGQSTTFLNGTDFMRKFQHYCLQKETLLPTTQFVTFQIYKLYTRVLHVDLRSALNRFLSHQLGFHRQQRLLIDAVEELTALVLRSCIFTYHGKVYRYIKGSPFNLPLTRLLADIYLQYWQIPLVRQIRITGQFYGRYHDQGFMTWHGTTDLLETCFSELNELHPDIQAIRSTGCKVHFLHAYIENRNGFLYTNVYHDPWIQRFLLPYMGDHPRLRYRQWFRFALMRAGQYCLSFEDFQQERLLIELTFLSHGYSIDFINYHIQQFLKRFSSYETLIDLNRFTYTSFRVQLFRHFNQQQLDLQAQQQLEKNRQLIHLHYLFDWGSRCEFNQQFYQLWSAILNADPTFKKFGLKIILTSKQCYLSNTLFDALYGL